MRRPYTLFVMSQRLYELESALCNIQAEIASNDREQAKIRAELTSIATSMVAVGTTDAQRHRMVSRTAELTSRYGEIAATTRLLERRGSDHERELRDYQQTLAAQF